MLSRIATSGVKLPFPPEGNFMGHNGPVYGTVNDNGRLELGFLVEARHCNSSGSCHGGMLATFADMQSTFGSRYALKLQSFLPTISLSVDFLAGAKLGQWVTGETQVLKATRNLIFCQCLIYSGGEIVLRSNATLKNARPEDPPHSMDLQALFGPAGQQGLS